MKASKKGKLWLILIPIFIILVIINGIRSCVGGDTETTTVASATGIESFDFSNSDPLELNIGETDRSYFTVEFDSDELSTDDIVFISSDEAVATITFDKKVSSSFIYYYVNAIGSGTATVHVETADGLIKSEAITVTVTEETTAERNITIKSIEFNNSKPLELTVDGSEYDYIRVVYEGEFIEDDIIFVSSDENVATVETERKKNSLLYFTINAVGTGSAKVHAETVDGLVKSEEISITVVKEPETEAKKGTEAANSPASDIEYVLNTSRMKIHFKSCPSVKDIASDNYAETNDYDGAIADGYLPCGRCNP